MEQMTINFGKKQMQVSLRVYDYEREAYRKAARSMGISIVG